MIKTTFGELDFGDEYWDDRQDCDPDILQIKGGGRTNWHWADGSEILLSVAMIDTSAVYIKEKKMTDREQAIESIKKAEAEIKKAKAILSKPDRIKVPDCIDMAKWSDGIHILFNDKVQRLCQHGGIYNVQSMHGGYGTETDLYLEPCKREDLEPGDVAYMRSSLDNDFSMKEHYFCILSDKEIVCVEHGKDITVESGEEYGYHWKVVK